MRIFKQDNKELKDFEEIILDIEKERDTISWCHATIQNCLWNLENPKVERWVIDWCVRDLRENLSPYGPVMVQFDLLKSYNYR